MGGVARIGGTHFTLAGMRHGQRSVILINAMLCTYLPPLLVSGDFSWGAREIQWLDLEFHYFCVDKSYSLMTCNKDIHARALGVHLIYIREVSRSSRSRLLPMFRSEGCLSLIFGWKIYFVSYVSPCPSCPELRSCAWFFVLADFTCWRPSPSSCNLSSSV